MLILLFSLSFSKIKKIIKKKHYLNNEDIVNLDLFYRLGWNNMTWDSVDELNRAFYTFGINEKNQIRLFLALCTFISKKGTFINEENPKSTYFGKLPFKYSDPYRGSGYLLMKGAELYQALSKIIGDNNIHSKGADYVCQYYPWASAIYNFKRLQLHNYKTFTKETLYLIFNKFNGNDDDNTHFGGFWLKIVEKQSPYKELMEIFNQINNIY